MLSARQRALVARAAAEAGVGADLAVKMLFEPGYTSTSVPAMQLVNWADENDIGLPEASRAGFQTAAEWNASKRATSTA